MSFSKLLKWIFLTPVILICLIILACGIEMLNFKLIDNEIKHLCEQFAKPEVFEQVLLSPEEYEIYGGGLPSISMQRFAKYENHKYFGVGEITPYRRFGYLMINKFEISYVRIADNKVLGKMTLFRRSGGIFPSYLTHVGRYNACYNMEGINERNLVNKVFVLNGH